MLFVSVVAQTHQAYAGKVLLVPTDVCVLRVEPVEDHSAQLAHRGTVVLLLTDFVLADHTMITAV
jgi:hypothetical protein